jgi:L-iditol 2-dehydrogenase
LSVVLQALTRTSFGPGESLLVVGAGAIGQLACAAARASGASFVGAVDIDAGRVAFAADNGWADDTLVLPLQRDNSSDSSEAEPLRSRAEEDRAAMELVKQQAAAVQSAFPCIASSGGFDVVLECSGVPACVALSIYAARSGGRVGLIGMGHPVQTLPVGAAALREVDLVGVFRYAGMYPKAIDLLASGALRASGFGRQATEPPGRASHASSSITPGGIENLFSHRFRLVDARAAFEVLRAGRSEDGRGVVKVFVSEE